MERTFPLIVLACCSLLLLLGCSSQAGKTGAGDRVAAWQSRKFGMFIHWGLYSIPAGVWDGQRVERGYSEQIQMWADIPHADYAALAQQFDPQAYDPEQIVLLAKAAGMDYIVITTKHHDGFCMWDSQTTDYDIVDATPYGRDALRELADACRKHDIGLGFYFSLIDWHAGHAFDPNNNNPIPESMEPMIKAQLEELLTGYGPLVEFWFDMSSPTLEQSRAFAALVREHQPGCMVNGRVWNNQGDFMQLGDNEVPDYRIHGPWQTPASIYRSTWGYRSWQERDDLAGKTIDLTRNLISVVSHGGNYLLNIGPRGDGAVVPFEANVLRGVGRWTERYGQTLYAAQPSPLPPFEWGVATQKDDRLFLHVFDWPVDRQLTLPGAAPLGITDGHAFGLPPQDSPVVVSTRGEDVVITLPDIAPDLAATVIELTCQRPDRLPVHPLRVTADADGKVTIPADRVIDHISRAGTDYYGQAQTVVEQTAQFQTSRAGLHHVTLRLDRAPGLPLCVRLFDKDFYLTPDADGILGITLALRARQTYNLGIALADPDYRQQDLGVRIESITIEPALR